jgi:hypothetical protein
MSDPRTEPKFGLYLMQDDDALWCWCFATQPPGELFHVHIDEERFTTPDAAFLVGQRHHGLR